MTHAPRPATGAPLDQLQELVQLVRRELAVRRESPSGEWVEEVAADLRAGRKPGWYLPTAEGGGLAFYSEQASEAFGHVHVDMGPEAEARALALANVLLDHLREPIRSIDIGWTGMPPDGERRVAERLAARPGSTVIARQAVERALTAADGQELGATPGGLTLVPLTDVTVDALASLDQRAYVGTVDELLVGPRLEDHRRVIESLLVGNLGPFLGEASAALLAPGPPHLVGALFTAEQSPRHAVFLNFMVDPADRGRGYGRYLLHWGLRALRALGYDSVHLWVTDANVPARTLYEETGFRPVASATIYRWERPVSAPQAHASR